VVLSMSLLDLLLQEPSAAQRALGVIGMTQQSAPPTPGGGRLRPAGVGGQPYTGSLPPQDLATEIARKLERRGFQVGGLEGFQGTGQISTGHIDNSQHYSGMAGDVTYYGGGRWPNENAALDWAENWLNRRYGDALTELIWQEPGHYGHLHYGTRPGG
jgi:hypothetical protein